ncbi:9316_t:CDS:2, partial [Diversispora eburnea]
HPTRIQSETDRWKRIRCEEGSQDLDKICEQVFLDNSKEATSAIIETMLELKCCARCILRYLNVLDYDFYFASEETLFNFINRIQKETIKSINTRIIKSTEQSEQSLIFSDTTSNNNNKPICVTCLDLLYQVDTYECIWPIYQSILAHNFDVKDFNLSVSLPSGIFVNNHSMLVWIRKTFKDLKIEEGTLKNLIDLIDLKEVFKYLLGKSIEKKTGMKYINHSEFNISIEFSHFDTQQNHMLLTRIPSANFELKKTKVKGKSVWVGDSRSNIINALSKVSDDDFLRICNYCPPPVIRERWEIKPPILEHEAVYVGAPTSVSECIGEILREKFMCDDYIFVPAGREDVNVRMLGTGRPFFIEIINPRKPYIFQEILNDAREEINKRYKDLVRCERLKMIDEKDLSIIKEGEENKTKTYSALVWISKKVTPEIIEKINKHKDGFILEQQTPIRVLQRRSSMIRLKKIHSIFAEEMKENDQIIILKLKTEAGTYIKEFIHGDLGRTKPSLNDMINCTSDILALDVLEVDLEWPIE